MIQIIILRATGLECTGAGTITWASGAGQTGLAIQVAGITTGMATQVIGITTGMATSLVQIITVMCGTSALDLEASSTTTLQAGQTGAGTMAWVVTTIMAGIITAIMTMTAMEIVMGMVILSRA